jgi:hypothetical protein
LRLKNCFLKISTRFSSMKRAHEIFDGSVHKLCAESGWLKILIRKRYLKIYRKVMKLKKKHDPSRNSDTPL